MARIALAAVMLLALAACDRIVPGISGSSTAVGNTVSNRALGGCASGEHADFLHQNRPGGSDFSASRCSEEGY